MILRLQPFARRAVATVALAGPALASACAGSAGNGALVPGAAQPNLARPAAPASARTAVSFVVTVPATTQRVRRAAYVSPNTGSIVLRLQSVNGKAVSASPTTATIGPSSPGCRSVRSALMCTIGVAAPGGNDLFAIATYRSKSGTGPVLATASVVAVVTAASPAKVALDLDGVPASLTFSPARLPLVADGAVHRIAVAVDAVDASGAVIVGPQPYRSPVNLQILNDPAGALSLSTSSVARPGTTLTVTYDASKTLSEASIVAHDNAMAPATLVAAPLRVTPWPVTIFDDAQPTAVTLSETGLKRKFAVRLARRADAAITVAGGTLGSGTAVVTVKPHVSFDVTSLDVSDGNLSVAVPVQILPHNGTYAAIGAAHILASPYAMISGPNGSLWVSDPGSGSLVEFTPSKGTYVAHLVDPSEQGPLGIAFDASGNLWYADGSQIGEYSPKTGAIATYSTGLEPSANVTELIPGSNGRLWFYDLGTFGTGVSGSPTYFGSIETANGQIAEYPVASGAGPVNGRMSMTFGHDGSIWFADQYNAKIGRFDPASGKVAEYATGTAAFPQQSPMQVLAAPDGRIWFVADGFTSAGAVVGSLDPAHPKAIAYQTNGTVAGLFYTLVRGPHGNLWFTQSPTGGIGISSQLALGVVNPATGATYEYPAAVPEFVKGAALVDRGNTLWMLDSAYGQIGKVTFK